jgi:membrane associated rhomboid family serine protease
VTTLLIAVNTLVFLVGPVSGLDPFYSAGAVDSYYRRWGVIPDLLLSGHQSGFPGPALSVLTAMFVHGSWLHLLGNMLFLYVFGGMVEGRLGRRRFLLFYLGIGYLATLGYALAEWHGAAGDETLVGASGAIAGVLGAYLLLFPRARVTSVVPMLLFLPLRFPAWLVLGMWFAIQAMSLGAVSAAEPGVAYIAHLIGFTGGFLFAWLLYSERWPRRTASARETAS